MTVRLSEGAIESLTKGIEVSNPVLQCVNIRKIDGGNGLSRFRVMMSDGLHTMSSFMLSTQLNPMAEQNQLATNCVCMLKRSVANVLKDGRRVVVILDMEVIKSADQMAGKIGDPTPYVEGQSKPQQSTAPAPTVRPLQPQNGSDGSMNRPAQSFGKRPMAAPSTPGGSSKVVPIASLNPYQSKWTVRARVTNKNSIRTWSNSRGDGKLFSMELVDESGEIRATGFNHEVDKFYSLIEQGKVYYISKGTLKIANKQFSSLKNDYEMTLNGETSIIPCEDSHDVPKVQCDFVSIADLESREKDTIVDVIAVCKNTEDMTRIMTKNSREVSKRNIQLMDMSGRVIQLTMWGNDAETFDGSGHVGVVVTVLLYCQYFWLCVIWHFKIMYDKEGHAIDGQSMTELRGPGGGGGNTNWKTLVEVKNEHLGHGDKADYFSCIATIVYIRKENCLYQACPSKDCNKKVVDQQNGMYRCEKCDKEFPDFKYRLMLSANIADFGDNQWVTCFQDSAETLLGQNSGYLGQLKDSNEAAFDEVFLHANFNTFVFRNRVKMETYNDESRIKVTVVDAKPVDHREYSKRLIINIRKLAAQ
ncbi:replication protein A 70 kDa DNA-binding subunit-like [Sinocyclocheilus anshuiensis]|uniref:replication protein A 70 kDa DNA-binding subunit-like n=1 Tax=Sinocyclocheilus anshuiensis TaxID=1608454 RepID=UPI0007B7C087|nr:PREDICTED: replication protein A 70 kDa DNA-binding subunit-like [Sinocyclocheilus anshuiensis]